MGRSLFVCIVALALSGCLTPEQREGARQGASTGFAAFGREIPAVLSATETGGVAAGAMALALAAAKAISMGLAASKRKRIDEVAEGVKKATNGS